jgi:hypothetical protein
MEPSTNLTGQASRNHLRLPRPHEPGTVGGRLRCEISGSRAARNRLRESIREAANAQIVGLGIRIKQQAVRHGSGREFGEQAQQDAPRRLVVSPKLYGCMRPRNGHVGGENSDTRCL